MEPENGDQIRGVPQPDVFLLEMDYHAPQRITLGVLGVCPFNVLRKGVRPPPLLSADQTLETLVNPAFV